MQFKIELKLIYFVLLELKKIKKGEKGTKFFKETVCNLSKQYITQLYFKKFSPVESYFFEIY